MAVSKENLSLSSTLLTSSTRHRPFARSQSTEGGRHLYPSWSQKVGVTTRVRPVTVLLSPTKHAKQGTQQHAGSSNDFLSGCKQTAIRRYIHTISLSLSFSTYTCIHTCIDSFTYLYILYRLINLFTLVSSHQNLVCISALPRLGEIREPLIAKLIAPCPILPEFNPTEP